MSNRKMTLREGILDSLKDEGESITQIQEYLHFLGHKSDFNEITLILESLLAQSAIKIVYPLNESSLRLSYDKESIKKYWFELTDRGKVEWESIKEA